MNRLRLHLQTFFTLALLLLSTPVAQAQYQWTNFVGLPGGLGNVNGTGNSARFDGIWGSVADSSGNIYVADYNNNVIRKVTPAGVVTTFAGAMGVAGLVDGSLTSARFSGPAGLAIDTSGNLYVADRQNNAIRKITTGGVVSTLAGGSGGYNDGTGSAAQFFAPEALAVDSSGNIYVADTGSHSIRKVTQAGVVTTFAGQGYFNGSADGTGNAARFWNPGGIVYDGSANLYVADFSNATIRKIVISTRAVTTIAGQVGVQTTVDGTGTSAKFRGPYGIAMDAGGNLYVSEPDDCVLRKITPSLVVTTMVGTVGVRASADGTGSAASFDYPRSVTVDAAGNLYVCDAGSSTLRKVTSGSVVTTLAGEPPHPGSADGTGTAARFYYPSGLATDGSGNLYVADQGNHTIRKITTAGVVTTLAGSPGLNGADDGTGGAARFEGPLDVAVDGSGNVFVADGNNITIRKITPAGVVTTFAGTAGVFGTDDGTGAAAQFGYATGLDVDASGNVYVADQGNHTIRKITPAGVVTTLAGLPGVEGSTDGTGSAARFSFPNQVAVDSSGNVYVTDMGNATIRKVTPAGVVTTVAGSPGVLEVLNGTGSAAHFYNPLSIAVDGGGNLYVTEGADNIVRKITPAGVVTTIGGTRGVTDSADGIDSAAHFSFGGSGFIASTPVGTLYVADTLNYRISRAAVASATPTVTTPTSASITGTGATLGGDVTSDGGSAITERGVVYSVTSTNSSPQIGGTGVTTVTASGTTGVFTAGVSSLTPATGYSFAAYATNSVGTTYTSPVSTFTTLSDNANLSALTTTAGALDPAFAAGTITYTASVANAVSSITVTPTKADANAALQARVNGGSYASVTSGSPSGALALNVGGNTVEVLVTAQDGTTTKTYTVTVTRAAPMSAPTVTTPTSASITGTAATLGGNVTSDGGDAITTRGVVLAKTTDDATPTLGEPNVTNVTTSGTTGVFTVSASSLTPGTGYTFVAYATNSTGTTYTTPVSTFTTLNNNADLIALTLSSGTLAPAFASVTTSYGADVLRPVTSITTTPTVSDSNATLQVQINNNGYSSVASGSPSGNLALNLGDNAIIVRVTAQDGVTQKFYTVNLRRWTYLEAWRNQYFGTINNSGSAADTATPQNDGIANLMKFALGMNPTVSGVQPIGVAKNGSTLEFTYPRSVEATVECTFIVEWSDTLLDGSWSAVGVTEQILSDNGILQQVKASVDVAGLPRRFMRLRVTLPEVIE